MKPFLVLVACLAACGSPAPSGAECIAVSDCPRNNACVNGMCLPLETQDGGPSGDVPASDAPGTDVSESDAGPGLDASSDSSIDPRCGMECDTELACETGTYDCASGEPVCVPSGVRPAGTECRPSAGACDAADVCDGESTACPDRPAPVGTPCDAGFCTATGACGACEPNAPCQPSPCTTGTTVCSADGVPSCRANGDVVDGTSCGEETVGGWGSCSFDTTCDEAASRSRTRTRLLCMSGDCRPSSSTDSESCTRDTDGVACGRSEGPWGPCGFSSTCDETGSQSRTVTDLSCAAGSCAGAPRSETRSCSRADTDGTSCGSPTYGTWGSCLAGLTCSDTGTQTRSVTTRLCDASEMCATSSSTESRSCTRDPEGQPCRTRMGSIGTCDAAGRCIDGIDIER